MDNSKDECRRIILAEGFDRRARHYHRAHWLENPLLLDYPISLLKLRGHEIALEMGIGAGHFASRIQSQVGELLGVDISEKMLIKAAPRISRARLLKHDCEKLADLFLPESFDLVVSRNLLHHVDVLQALQSAMYVLKPLGKVLIVEASVVSPCDSGFFLEFADLLHPGHVDYPSHEELVASISEIGFSILHEEHVSAKVDLRGYLSSVARTDAEKERIRQHFANASEHIRVSYDIQDFCNDIMFLGYWSIVIGQKNN